MFTLPQLPYDYSALEPWIDTETMQLHHDKHHQTYVDNLNKALEGQDKFLNMEIKDLITNLNQVPEDIRMKVRNNGGGHFNHSLFWTLLAPKPTQPTTALSEEISTTFGAMDKFQEEFNTKGLARFGSGWVWLIREDGKLKIEDTPNQDNPLMRNPAVEIILGLDVWEHAYYLKYQNRRKDYLQAWWNVVNWKI